MKRLLLTKRIVDRSCSKRIGYAEVEKSVKYTFDKTPEHLEETQVESTFALLINNTICPKAYSHFKKDLKNPTTGLNQTVTVNTLSDPLPDLTTIYKEL